MTPAYAIKCRFSTLTSRETIDPSYAAYLRILAKIAARKKGAQLSLDL